MGSFRLIEAECYIRNIADNGNPDQECHQAPVFFDFIFLFQQLFFFDMELFPYPGGIAGITDSINHQSSDPTTGCRYEKTEPGVESHS